MASRLKCSFAVLVTVTLMAVSCSKPQPPPDPGVANAELAIKLATIPDGLTVAKNQGSDLELRPTGEAASGVISFFAGPEQEGVNLVLAVNEHQAAIESLPDGEYKGGQELMGDFGSAFYSRGQFTEGDGTTEETVIFVMHPSESRFLGIRYEYPSSSDSATRVEQLIGVLAELE